MTEGPSRRHRRRAAYLNHQAEEAERAHAKQQIAKAETLFAQERRRSYKPTLTLSLGDKLRAAGFRGGGP